MDKKSQELYQEEQLEVLKSLKTSIDTFVEAFDGTEIKQNIVLDKVQIESMPDVNTETEVAISNLDELKTAFTELSNNLTKAIQDSAHKPLSELTIKNIKDAHQNEIKVTNLNELKSFISEIAESIERNQPIVNVQKQEITFPRSAKEAIPVRLSDGKSFYKAVAQAFSSGGSMASFKDADNKGVQVQLTSSGAVPVDIQDATVTINGDVTVSSEVEVKNDTGNPVPVSAASLPLPSNASTSALQTTGNTSLSSIDTKTPALGQALAAASTPVVLTAAQLSTLTPPAAITGFLTESDFDTKTGSLTETAPATDTASSGLNGRLQRIAQRLTSIIALLPGSLGQKARAASLAVTLSTEDITALTPTTGLTDAQLRASAVPVSLASVPSHAVTNAGTFATQAAQSGTWNIGTVTTLTGITNALPAGTNAIGKLAANSGVDIGDVDVTSSVSSTLDHGSNLDIDTGAEQITTTSFSAKFGITLKADITNTGIIYIGNSDVTAGTTAATDGFPLSAGETLTLEVNNSNIPYAIASANNQKLYWIGV